MKTRLLILLSFPLLWTACKKNEDISPVVRGRTNLHLIAAYSGESYATVFDYFNSANVVAANLSQNTNWPTSGYANLLATVYEGPGSNELLNIFTLSNTSTDTITTPTPLMLEADKKYTIAIADDGNGGAVMLNFEDNFAKTGGSNVRFINLDPALGTANLVSSDFAVDLGSTAFLQTSGFIEFPAGTYDLQVRDAGGTIRATLDNIDLPINGVQTFYIYSDSIQTQLSSFWH